MLLFCCSTFFSFLPPPTILHTLLFEFVWGPGSSRSWNRCCFNLSLVEALDVFLINLKAEPQHRAAKTEKLPWGCAMSLWIWIRGTFGSDTETNLLLLLQLQLHARHTAIQVPSLEIWSEISHSEGADGVTQCRRLPWTQGGSHWERIGWLLVEMRISSVLWSESEKSQNPPLYIRY